MTKVEVNIGNVDSNCVPCCESLYNSLELARNKFRQVSLPFSCSNLDQAINNISSVMSLVSEYSDELKSAKDFCLKSENAVVSDINGIDNFNI